MKFKKNDWCFFEFKLSQIQETEEGRITSISDGIIRTGSYDASDRCFALSMKIKNISDEVAYWSKRFHELKNNSLNHPDLHRELVKRWVEMCEEKDDDRLKKLYESLSVFGNLVTKRVKDLQQDLVAGVKLFR